MKNTLSRTLDFLPFTATLLLPMLSAYAAPKPNDTFSGYGSISVYHSGDGICKGLSDHDCGVRTVDEMIDNYHIKDFQFYGWQYLYYEGIHNSTQWWNQPVWAGNRHKDFIVGAIQEIKTRGGRSWAYVQASWKNF